MVAAEVEGWRWFRGLWGHVAPLLGVLGLIGVTLTSVFAGARPWWLVPSYIGGGLLVLFVAGAYRLWDEADRTLEARHAELSTKDTLNRLGTHMRDANELRRQLASATDEELPSRETASLRWALEVVGTLHAGGLDYGAVAQFDDDSGFDPALLPKPETNSFDRDNLDRYLQRRLRRLDRLIDSLRG